MAHLPIQIVDENDKPIGQADMPEAHKKGLIHRIVRVMVENHKGEILVQKRSPKMRRWPNCWDNSAAGHVDVGEDYLTAAKRELAEELGIDNVELQEIDTYFTDVKLADDVILKRFNRLYKIKVDDTPKNLQADEVTEVKWMTVDEAKKLVKASPDSVTDGLQDVLERYYWNENHGYKAAG